MGHVAREGLYFFTLHSVILILNWLFIAADNIVDAVSLIVSSGLLLCDPQTSSSTSVQIWPRLAPARFQLLNLAMSISGFETVESSTSLVYSR